MLLFHPGLSKIPARVGGPGSDIIILGITIGGQKLGAGRFLIPSAGWGLTRFLPKFASAFDTSEGSKCWAYCMKCNLPKYVQLLDAFYRDMVHFILIMMSFPGPPTRAGIFDNPW